MNNYPLVCLYGVAQESACEDDACYECQKRVIQGKDIICSWDGVSTN
jgi:hypothetical protein